MDSLGQSFCSKIEIWWCSLNLTFGSWFHFIFGLSFHNSTRYARCYSCLFSVAKVQLLYSSLLQICLSSDIVFPLPSQLSAPEFSTLGSHVHIHSCRAASVPIYQCRGQIACRVYGYWACHHCPRTCIKCLIIEFEFNFYSQQLSNWWRCYLRSYCFSNCLANLFVLDCCC